MIKMKGLVHFTIPVNDCDRAEKFYKDVLGFDLVRKTGHMVFMKNGDDQFVLTHTPKSCDLNLPNQHEIHTAFRVDPDEYDRALKYLAGKGVKVFKEEKRETGTFQGRSAYFHDPDMNVLEIIDQTNK
jgi:catechol 2,3-dioxygenase-like lactoylglutathione lyase family enzyme